MSSFRRLSFVALATTLLLVAIGGLVRATDSGLGCADAWPDCSGRIIPDFHNHHVVIEFTHRLVAGVVVLLLAALALKAFRIRAERPELLRPSLAALGLVLFQAGLGAVVVKLHLEKQSVMLHLGAAMAVVAILVYLAGKASALATSWKPEDAPGANRIAQASAGAVLGLLLVGSYTTGYPGAGRAFNDWPLMDGRIVPDLTIVEKAVHFGHRALALLVGIYLLVGMVRVIRLKTVAPLAARFAHAALGLFAVEVAIGAANVWSRNASGFVTLHLAVGALIWTSLIALAVVTHPGLGRRAAGDPVRSHRALEGTS